MKNMFTSKSFKTLVATVVVLILLVGISNIFDISIISSITGYITSPMQRVSASVVDMSSEKSYDELLAENEALKSEVASLRAKLADYENTRTENARLWKYYGLKKENPDYSFVPVSVIRRDGNDKFYSFTIDRGTNEDISLNDPVVTENGLVGYISSLSRTYAVVTTILSPDLSAGARDVKSKDTGVICGDARLSDSGLVTMTQLAENNKIKVGHQISTTGIGGMYPENISVGQVKELKYREFDTSLYAVIEPYEDIRNVTDVVVITSFNGQGDIKDATLDEKGSEN